jgi:hypothetical protein
LAIKMLGMRGSEFQNYFEKIPIVNKQFLKITSIDEIPKDIKEKHFVISNLSPSNELGSHWITLIQSEKNTLEIFNSLGMNSIDRLQPYLKTRKKVNVIFNEQPFQSKESTSCGFFCIYFIVHRILNLDMSFEHLLEHIFSANCEINENKVVNFCRNLNIGDFNIFDDED